MFKGCVAFALVLAAALTTPSAAQVGAFLNCSATAGVPPLMRSEGVTELAGDIVLSCTGSVSSPVTATFQVFLTGVDLTSRLIGSAGTQLSESVLLIDEPPSTSALFVCASPLSGCAGANAIPGIVTGNSIAYYGVSIVPKGSTAAYTFRIANIRANASAVVQPPLNPGMVEALVTTMAPMNIGIANPAQIIGFTQRGLGFSVRDAENSGPANGPVSLPRCTGHEKYRLATLRFAENSPTAFRLKTVGMQNMPGVMYISESGLIVPGLSGPGPGPIPGPVIAGLADFATRVKAVFTNVPAGVKLYVGTQDLAPVPMMSMVATESGIFAPVPPAENIGGFPAVELPVVNGTATAIYEITRAEPMLGEFADVPVWISYVADVPPVTTSSARLAGSFAPTSTGLPWTSASATAPVPRFVDASTPLDFLAITGCGAPPVTFGSTLADIDKFLGEGAIDNQGTAQALSTHIRSAEAAAARGSINAALGSLRAFQNLVRAQTGKHIHPSAVPQLLRDAQALIDQLSAR